MLSIDLIDVITSKNKSNKTNWHIIKPKIIDIINNLRYYLYHRTIYMGSALSHRKYFLNLFKYYIKCEGKTK